MAKPVNVICPDCLGPMVPRMSARGKFWGCAGFPQCKGTRNADGDSLTARRRSDPDEDESLSPGERQRGNDRRRWDSQ